MSEGLHDDGVQQGHVLGSSDRQLVCGVVVNDLGDGEEGGAVLPQHVTAICGLGELHVHEALTAPDRKEEHLLSQTGPKALRTNRPSYIPFNIHTNGTTSRIYEGFFFFFKFKAA